MGLNSLTSIETIQKVFPTGDLPVLIKGSDRKFHVVKHNHGQSICYKLFAEYLVHQLFHNLGLPVMPASFFEIQSQHVVPTGDCQPAFFRQQTCFSTLYVESVYESNHLSATRAFVKPIANKRDLLTIGWMDLWLANEDRNYNNNNLLLNSTDSGIEITPIDHAACFNSLSFSEGRRLYLLGENESIIHTPLFQLSLKGSVKSMREVSETVKRLYLRIPNLESDYHEIVTNLPESWQIPLDYIAALHANLFEKAWLDETKHHFLTFVKSSLKL
jgi:hypothetical protein